MRHAPGRIRPPLAADVAAVRGAARQRRRAAAGRVVLRAATLMLGTACTGRGAVPPVRPQADGLAVVTDRYTGWLFAGATDSLWGQLSERGRRRWPTPESLAAFHRQIVAVVPGFERVVRDSIERTDTLVTVTRYGISSRDGVTYHVRFRLIPADARISAIGVEDAGVEAATPYLDSRTRAPLRLPFAGEWIVFWGGRTVAQNYHAAYPTQRFALDLVPASDSVVLARVMRGEPTRLADFACFGHPMLSPSAGIVVAAVDGVPDNAAGELPAVSGWGNHVVIDLGTGEFALLAHLQQGSVAVRPGQRVAAGALVGACGNSGRTTHPHLHFDVLTGPVEGRGTFSLPAQFLDYDANGRPVARGEPRRWERIRARL